MSAAQSDNGSDANACRPCRTTGRLISGLGGATHEVVCPWCRGTGRRIPGRNPQDSPAEGGAAEPAGEGGAAEPAGEGGAAEPVR